MKRKHFIIGLIPILLASCSKSNTLTFKQTATFKTLNECKQPTINRNETIDTSFINSTLQVFQKTLKETNHESENKNFVISPISLYYALSMLRNGTGNDEEFSKFMDLADTDLLNENIKKHYKKTYLNEKNAKMQVANSIWVNQDFQVKQTYLDILKQYYFADMYSVDFAKDSTLENIAKWVNYYTKDLLEQTVENYRHLQEEPPAITLMNTIYFNCEWLLKESISESSMRMFYGQKQQKNVSCFWKQTNGAFYEGEDYLMINDGFVGNNKIFYVLPNENQTIDTIINSKMTEISKQMFEKWTEGTEEYLVRYWIPEFDVDYNIEYMNQFPKYDFAINTYGFNEMINSASYVDSINQTTRLILNRKGVEAAAVTEVGNMGATPLEKEVKLFEINRPFLYIITDCDNIPLFTGVIKDL